MKQCLAWNSGEPYVQSSSPLSMIWHTLLATVSHQIVFHLTSLPLHWFSILPYGDRKLSGLDGYYVHENPSVTYSFVRTVAMNRRRHSTLPSNDSKIFLRRHEDFLELQSRFFSRNDIPPSSIYTQQYPTIPNNTHQYPSIPTNTHQYPSVPIRTHRYSSIPIDTHQNPSIPINTHRNRYFSASRRPYCWPKPLFKASFSSRLSTTKG